MVSKRKMRQREIERERQKGFGLEKEIRNGTRFTKPDPLTETITWFTL